MYSYIIYIYIYVCMYVYVYVYVYMSYIYIYIPLNDKYTKIGPRCPFVVAFNPTKRMSNSIESNCVPLYPG